MMMARDNKFIFVLLTKVRHALVIKKIQPSMKTERKQKFSVRYINSSSQIKAVTASITS